MSVSLIIENSVLDMVESKMFIFVVAAREAKKKSYLFTHLKMEFLSPAKAIHCNFVSEPMPFYSQNIFWR